VVGSRLVDACEHIDTTIIPVYWMYDLFGKEDYDRYGLWDIAQPLLNLHCGKNKVEVFSTSTETETESNIRTWQILAGGEEAFREKPNASLIVCPISPLYLSGRKEQDDPFGHADQLMAAAKAGVPASIGVCGLMGASSPITIGGLITQSIAEVLAMNVAFQTINPGHPISVNDYTGALDMFTGQKQEARPEAELARTAMIEMSHFLGLPITIVNNTGAVQADAQMAWENMANCFAQGLAGADFVGAGCVLGGDDIFDPRALLISNEIIGWFKHFQKGFEMNADAIPLDLMIEVGTAPRGGNYLGTKHTKSLFKELSWKPSKLTNSLSRDNFLEGKVKSINERAVDRANELLDKHEPNIPDNQQKALRDYISEILDRNGVKGDEAKEIMDKTYWEYWKK